MKYIALFITLITISIHAEETIAQKTNVVLSLCSKEINVILHKWYTAFKTAPLFEIHYQPSNLNLISKIRNHTAAHPYRIGITALTATALMGSWLIYKINKKSDSKK